jgi:hypothetical protein
MGKQWGLGALFAVALAGPAWGQGFGGVNPANIHFVPIDTSNSVVPTSTSPGIGLTGFKLGTVFPNHTYLSNSRTLGASVYPTDNESWLRAFNFQRPARKSNPWFAWWK